MLGYARLPPGFGLVIQHSHVGCMVTLGLTLRSSSGTSIALYVKDRLWFSSGQRLIPKFPRSRKTPSPGQKVRGPSDPVCNIT